MRFVENNIKDLKQKIKLEGGKGVLQKTKLQPLFTTHTVSQ